MLKNRPVNPIDTVSGKTRLPIESSRVLCAGLLLLLATSASLLLGQSPQLNSVNELTQAPVPGVGHDYEHLLGETVNFSNASVNLKISFPTSKGRGLSLPFAWSYNSASVNPLDNSGGALVWDLFGSENPQATEGWNLSVGYPRATAQVWSVSGNTTDSVSGYPDAPGYIPCNFQSGMTFTDMSGTTHNLGTGAQTSPSTGTYQTCQVSPVPLPPNGDGEVVAALPSNATTFPNYLNTNSPPSSTPFIVMDQNGTVYTFAGGYSAQSPGGNFPASSIEDRNGNVIGAADTLGNPVQTPNYDNSNNPFTIDGITYTPTWSTTPVNYTIQTNLSNASTTLCLGIPATVKGTRNVLTSLSLPPTSTSSSTGPEYQLSYDGTYGLLSEIIYPDGGWVKYTWQLPAGQAPYNLNEMASFGGSQSSTQGTSGAYKYTPIAFGCNYQYQEPVLKTRQVSYDGSTIAQTQTFTTSTYWGSGNWSTRQTQVVTYDNILNQTSETDYTYIPFLIPRQPYASSANAEQIPLESSVSYYDWGPGSTRGNLLKTVTKTWYDQFHMASETTTLANATQQTFGTVYKYSANICGTPATNSLVYLKEEDDYDIGPGALGPLSKITLYGYKCFAALPYLNPQNNPSMNYTFAGSYPMTPPPQVSSVTVENGSGGIESETLYGIDQYSSLSSVTATQHDDTDYGTLMTVRGNTTSVTKCNPLPSVVGATSCSGPTVSYAYDITGQPVSMTDACGNASCSDMAGSNHTTTFSFSDNPSGANAAGNSNAFLTNIAFPNGLSKSFAYIYAVGSPIGYLSSSKDENGQTTSYYYADPLFRPTETDYPDLGKTTISYTDHIPGGSSSAVQTNKYLNANQVESSIATLDGVGHVIETQLITDPYGTDIVNTTVNGEGSPYNVTNPYRTTPNGSTTNYFDALGRKIKTIEQDGNSLQWCYDGIASYPAVANCSALIGKASSTAGSVTGTWVDSTDESLHHWQRVSDAFGRLTQVLEPNGVTSSPTMETDYTYDPALSNLTKVVQWGGAYNSAGAVSRSFGYDVLSRLTSSANPETGAIAYSYDNNSNLSQKTDARGVSTNYIYDVINRVISKSYAFSGNQYATPISCFQYDVSSISDSVCTAVSPAKANLSGRLTNAWTQASGSSCTGSSGNYAPVTGSFLSLKSILAYDPMGRPQCAQQQQCVQGSCSAPAPYMLQMGYDWVGNNTALVNSVGAQNAPLTVGYAFDNADRPCLAGSSWQAGFSPNIFQTNPNISTPGYTAFGGIQNWYLGSNSSSPSSGCGASPSSPINLQQTFDKRMRVTNFSSTGQVP